MRLKNSLSAAFALILALATNAQAQDDVTVLSVTANGVEQEFTLAELQALPEQSFETTTIWTEGPQEFAGVSLKTLLDHITVTQGDINATAINDYTITIPFEDATRDGPIVAYHMNGDTMTRRGKGPLWIVYPYDSDLKYQTETIYSRSIWQLDRITIE